ncbi:MAG: Holliday junction branch migration protein RuvA [Kiritimatiellaceae bacterium]|nr:Holliday junction branch migration protein RuvA [Kiritimatiellaceae bacterium]|tara:strand:- start:3125 stop:3718 length:594 start_codon:yes stop_codon:yes gene_type:complete
MIAFLEGSLEVKELARIVINCGGVGYEVIIPLSSFERIPEQNKTCRLLIHHHITEADQKLYGFASESEREMFTSLITINGVGPKIAIAALSGLPVSEMRRAITTGDIKTLCSISGIGKKSAERIIVELRDRVGKGDQLEAFSTREEPEGDSRLRDAALALQALGQPTDIAAKKVKAIAKELTPEMSVEEIIRRALTY